LELFEVQKSASQSVSHPTHT